MSLFVREDWTLFRNLDTLGQRAGVSKGTIPRLVVKELVDNALDTAGACDYGATKPGGFYVADQGDGLPGDDTAIADLFSVARSLASSKLLRLPTRGALGNGLRVVAGAVLASGGRLVVKTRGRALRLRPRDCDGGTDVKRIGPWKGNGTRIEVLLGDSLQVDDDLFNLADRAARLVGGQTYGGKTSAWWYDSDSFFELLQAAGARPVRELVAQFAGCTGGKAGKLAGAFNGRGCDGLTREQAEELLTSMRDGRPVNAKRLGCVGPQAFPDAGYARQAGTFNSEAARGTVGEQIPYVAEAWATAADKPGILFHVNRTPITAELQATRGMTDKTLYGIFGCGLSDQGARTALPVKVGRGREFLLWVNLTTPYMPITTDGKAPNLSVVRDAIRGVLEKAIRRSKRKSGGGNGPQQSQAAVIVGAIPAAIEKASGGGQYRYSLRQLFYAVRPHVINALGNEPDYGYFSRVVGEYEADKGADLPGMYRDDRGILYHCHTGETIPLGTRAVEEYRRPEWTFNKILYCEKEGFFPILRDAQWPERHDCALLTSKGYASRAARDVLDLLGDGDEPLTFYAIHDADGPGTMIYQTLQEGTKARPGRRVEIVNLGLDPAEALDMGLPIERVQAKKAVPVADYVDGEWREWLQENRVELNAMDTPTFLAWLDRKMHGQTGKLIPPVNVLTKRLRADTRDLIQEWLIDDAIRAAGVAERTAAALDALGGDFDRAAGRLLPAVRKTLRADPAEQWTAPVAAVAEKLASKATRNGKG